MGSLWCQLKSTLVEVERHISVELIELRARQDERLFQPLTELACVPTHRHLHVVRLRADGWRASLLGRVCARRPGCSIQSATARCLIARSDFQELCVRGFVCKARRERVSRSSPFHRHRDDEPEPSTGQSRIAVLDDPAVEGDDEYSFWHALTHETAYAQLLKSERAIKHLAVADWIEHQAGERKPDQADLLAIHLQQAYDMEMAVGRDTSKLGQRLKEALVLAGTQLDQLDADMALDFYQRALQLTPREPKGEGRS